MILLKKRKKKIRKMIFSKEIVSSNPFKPTKSYEPSGTIYKNDLFKSIEKMIYNI